MTIARHGPQWRKSTRSSNTSSCVEVDRLAAVRDSKNVEGPVLRVDVRALVSGIKTGRFS